MQSCKKKKKHSNKINQEKKNADKFMNLVFHQKFPSHAQTFDCVGENK